jgi:RimJ/RimL family protein N-acetyltransferase
MKLQLVPIDLNSCDEKIYAGADCQLAFSMWRDYYPKIGFHPPWIGYFVQSGEMVMGSCAFTGPPKENKVEVSYWTFEAFESQGIGTRACQLLISLAWQTNPALIITAKTAPEENASTAILRKTGFAYSGIVQDHEIGDAWEWVLLPEERKN